MFINTGNWCGLYFTKCQVCIEFLSEINVSFHFHVLDLCYVVIVLFGLLIVNLLIRWIRVISTVCPSVLGSLSLTYRILSRWFWEGLRSSVFAVTIQWLLYKRTQHEASLQVPRSRLHTRKYFIESTCCSALEQSATKSRRCYCSHIV